MTRLALAVAITFVSAAIVACSSAPIPDPGAPRSVRELEVWDIEHAGAQMGQLRLLEIEDPGGAIRFYRVENPAGQWLGYIDSTGRLFRYVPFSTEEQFCGIYPMLEGVAMLFERDDGIKIVPRMAGAAEATGPRNPRRGRY